MLSQRRGLRVFTTYCPKGAADGFPKGAADGFFTSYFPKGAADGSLPHEGAPRRLYIPGGATAQATTYLAVRPRKLPHTWRCDRAGKKL